MMRLICEPSKETWSTWSDVESGEGVAKVGDCVQPVNNESVIPADVTATKFLTDRLPLRGATMVLR